MKQAGVGSEGDADRRHARARCWTRNLPRTRTGRIWTYVGDDEHPYTVYDYTPNRSRDGPEEFLKEFRGYLQADAYSGYDHFYKEPERGIVEVACWAHSRRRFFEAQSSDLMRSTVMLAYIRLLYDVEREAREQKLEGGGAPSAAAGRNRNRSWMTSTPIWSESSRTCCPRAPRARPSPTRCRIGKP